MWPTGLQCCISFDSYIKPQRLCGLSPTAYVVYLLIPTSNHNLSAFIVVRLCVVYLLIPTSNHNSPLPHAWWAMVVYLLIPTSNHNSHRSENHPSTLYIFWFLHQTTTERVPHLPCLRCISFDSYIKPQLPSCFVCSFLCCISFDSYIKPQPRYHRLLRPACCISFDSYIKPQLLSRAKDLLIVVYLLIPTSNHN